MNPISKRKCYENESFDVALLFIYSFCYKYEEEEKITNTFKELHSKEYFSRMILFLNPIVTDDNQSSRDNVNMGRSKSLISIITKEKNNQFQK